MKQGAIGTLQAVMLWGLLGAGGDSSGTDHEASVRTLIEMVERCIPGEVINRYITPVLTRERSILARFRWYDSVDFDDIPMPIVLANRESANNQNLTYHLGGTRITIFDGTKVIGCFYKPPDTYVSLLSLHPTDDYVYVATYSNGETFCMIPGAVHRTVMFAHPSGKKIVSAQFSDDGRYVLSIDTDQHTRVWDYRAIKAVVDIFEGDKISWHICRLLDALRSVCAYGRPVNAALSRRDVACALCDLADYPLLDRYVRQAYGGIIAQVTGEDQLALRLLFE